MKETTYFPVSGWTLGVVKHADVGSTQELDGIALQFTYPLAVGGKADAPMALMTLTQAKKLLVQLQDVIAHHP